MLKSKLGYDDALDVFGVHGVGGALGALLTGVFAASAMTPGNVPGLIESGSLKLVVSQLIGIGAAAAYSAVVTAGILLVLKVTIGLRVTKDVEREGLDEELHGETGYALTAGTVSVARSDEEEEGEPVVASAPMAREEINA